MHQSERSKKRPAPSVHLDFPYYRGKHSEHPPGPGGSAGGGQSRRVRTLPGGARGGISGGGPKIPIFDPPRGGGGGAPSGGSFSPPKNPATARDEDGEKTHQII